MFGQNNNGFGGFMGYPQQAGMQYTPRPQAKMTQALTPEQIKKLKGTGGTFDLHVTQTDMWKAICTHKENGNIVLVENPDGTVTCPICGETFTLSYMNNEEVTTVTSAVKDILQSIKTMYLDIPEEMATQYFQIIPLLDKLPKMYEIAKNNFNMYDQSNPVMQGSNMYGFNALSAFTSPAFGMQQPMMMGGGNPAMYNQGGYMPQPGMPMQQPMMGGNPFGFNEAGYQPQPMQQPAQPQAAPQATQAAAAPAQDAQQVTNQKVFNV